MRTIKGLGQEGGRRKAIRLLQIGPRCDVLIELAAWFKSSPREIKRVLKKLQMIAEYDDLPRLSTIKRVGGTGRIIQISGGNGRLYCFLDRNGMTTVICVNTFWIGGGDKLKRQSAEIEEAERRMLLWQSARIVSGIVGARIARAG